MSVSKVAPRTLAGGSVSLLSGFGQILLAREGTGVPGNFSASAAVASEYPFRGLSQTDDAPVLQDGFGLSCSRSDTGIFPDGDGKDGKQDAILFTLGRSFRK